MIFEETLENDSFAWNSEIVADYVSVLMKNQKYA